LRYGLRAKKVFWCRRCRLFFIDPFPDEEALRTSYEGAASEFQKNYFESFQDLRSRSFTRGIEVLKRWGHHGRLLDVGTGLGFFLAQAREEGWETEGLEFSDKVAQYARRTLQLPVHVGTLESVSLQTGRYDVLTLWDVLEHFPNPKNSLLRIRELLVPGGMVVIRTPVCDSLIPWLLRGMYRVSFGRIRFGFEKLFKEHLFHFSEKGLRQLMAQCGFRVVEAYREDYIDYGALSHKEWAKHFFVRFGALTAILLSHLLKRQDEVVVYAESTRS